MVAASIPTLRPGYKELKNRYRNFSRISSAKSGRSGPLATDRSKAVPQLTENFRPQNAQTVRTDITSTTVTGNSLPLQTFEIQKTTSIDIKREGAQSSNDSNREDDGIVPSRTGSSAQLREVGNLV